MGTTWSLQDDSGSSHQHAEAARTLWLAQYTQNAAVKRATACVRVWSTV